jgi:hypothetical protein
MLTGAVNIAVFAAFRIRFTLRSISIAEYKPVCAVGQLDIGYYGWQKWQETARGMARNGKVGGKNGKDMANGGRTHVAARTVEME